VGPWRGGVTRIGVANLNAAPERPLVDTDLGTFATALYVRVEDLLKAHSEQDSVSPALGPGILSTHNDVAGNHPRTIVRTFLGRCDQCLSKSSVQKSTPQFWTEMKALLSHADHWHTSLMQTRMRARW
jgi:hypothetical protein